MSYHYGSAFPSGPDPDKGPPENIRIVFFEKRPNPENLYLQQILNIFLISKRFFLRKACGHAFSRKLATDFSHVTMYSKLFFVVLNI